MADTAKLITEVLTKIMSDITAMVIRQLDREKTSVKTAQNNTIRPLMECDVGEWQTVARDDRGKLRSRPDNSTSRTERTRPDRVQTHDNKQPTYAAMTSRRHPSAHSPVHRESGRNATPDRRRRQSEDRREYREARPVQVWTNRDRVRQRPRERRTRPLQNNYRTQDGERRERPHDDRRNARQEGRRHASIPPNDFARIKVDVYLVVRSVQMADHVDLWTARNPVRALTDGVRTTRGKHPTTTGQQPDNEQTQGRG